MFCSIASNPNSGIYSLPADEYALFTSLAKETAATIIKRKQEFVDDFANRVFLRDIEEGRIIGSNGEPVKPSPEQKEAWLAEFKEHLLDHLLKQESEELQESAERKFVEAEQKRVEAQKKFSQAEKERQDALTKQFWSIFNAKDSLPQEEYSKVFATYLADRSLTIEKTDDGKCFARINSMSSVIKYLKTNPLKKTCDFRAFKTEINDIDTLADFLKTQDAYAIKGVAFKSAISEIAKQKLAETVSARSSTSSPFKVQYFA